MPNALSAESSLYLRQHAENPVDWLPWGPEAFSRARREDKPVLVSVGYSACHWCHVMARECFEDAAIAELMNRHFVCVKVDREERPDVDKVMMDAVQMIAGHGGWPLNAFCLPDGRPFFGGTYFPPHDHGRGIIPWPELLTRIAERWTTHRADLVSNAEAILQNFAHQDAAPEAEIPLDKTALERAAGFICSQHDDTAGGFGAAPKFPAPMQLRFLLAMREASLSANPPVSAQRIDEVVTKSLGAMARGGIFDQIGGGFARYSVDATWTIPHFEKMLYDNAQLLSAYAEAWLHRREPLFRAVCEETIDWLEREMTLPGGVFAASLDADTDHHEGATYVWTPAQILEVLGEADAKRFCEAYGVDDHGNFEHGTSNPVFASGDFTLREELRPLREKLLAARNDRPQPGRDAKVLGAWNALAIAGLARCAWAFGRKDWAQRAMHISDFLWQNLRTEDGRLHAVRYAGDEVRHDGTLNDHAWLAEAELSLAEIAEWAEPGRHAVHRARALRLTEDIVAAFEDESAPGFFLSIANPSDPLAARRKEWWDNATPSGNAALAHVFSSIYALTGESSALERFEKLRSAYAGFAEQAPNGVSHALLAFARHDAAPLTVKASAGADWDALRCAALERHDSPGRIFLIPESSVRIGSFQVCRNHACAPETVDLARVF